MLLQRSSLHQDCSPVAIRRPKALPVRLVYSRFCFSLDRPKPAFFAMALCHFTRCQNLAQHFRTRNRRVFSGLVALTKTKTEKTPKGLWS